MQRASTRKPAVCDRRRSPRLGFDCPLRWNDGDGGVDRPGWTYDLSDDGVGFTTRALSAPRPGQRIAVALELDDENEWLVDSAATVVRSEPREHGLWAIGLQLRPPFDD